VTRTEIGTADYLRALARLEVRDRRVSRRIAELLGLVDALGPAAVDEPVESAGAPVETWVDGDSDAGAGPMALPVPAVSTLVDVPLAIEPLDARPVELSWPDNLPVSPHGTDTLGPRPPVPPLVRPRLERGIGQLMLASPRAGRELDLEQTLSAVARLDLGGPLPMRTEWTVHGGCDLLVDVSSALEPFTDDIDRLIRLAENVGGEATRILYFEQCPSRGVFSESEDFDEYRPQRRRTVVVGAFGASPARITAGTAEWMATVNQLRAHAEVVGVCPFEAGRAAFTAVIPMIPWSEATTTTVVGRVLGARQWLSSTS
jgi:hypothetical protein